MEDHYNTLYQSLYDNFTLSKPHNLPLCLKLSSSFNRRPGGQQSISVESVLFAKLEKINVNFKATKAFALVFLSLYQESQLSSDQRHIGICDKN